MREFVGGLGMTIQHINHRRKWDEWWCTSLALCFKRDIGHLNPAILVVSSVQRKLFSKVTVFIVYQVRYLAFNMRAILLPNQRTAPENLSPGWTRHKSSDTPDSKASCKYLVEIDSLWSIYSIWFNIKQYLKGFNDNFQKRRLFQSFRFWASDTMWYIQPSWKIEPWMFWKTLKELWLIARTQPKNPDFWLSRISWPVY